MMILLTGATGTAGSSIANEFVRERVPVRILVRIGRKRPGSKKSQRSRSSKAIWRDRAAWEAALDGVDRVLMISAPLMDMVETQSTFIDASKAAGVRHVIKFSGLDARPGYRISFWYYALGN